MRRTRYLVAIAIPAAAVIATATVRAAPTDFANATRLCPNVEFIGVRGSGDTSSSLGSLATSLDSDLRQLARERGVLGYASYGLPYTAVGLEIGKKALLKPIAYRLSERQGRNMLRAYIRQTVHDCAGVRLAVVGYSQGAQVVGDVFSKKVGGLSSDELRHVSAVALIADPRFNSKEKFDHGSFRSGRNGLLGARSRGDLASVTGRVAAWCRRDDVICQGPGSTENHKQSHYLDDYRHQIVEFLRVKLGFPDHFHGGDGVVTSGAVGKLRLGSSDGSDVLKYAGNPDHVWYAGGFDGWIGFANYSVIRLSPGVHVFGYLCTSRPVSRAPCMSFYALDDHERLIGFDTNSREFRTSAGTHPGSTIGQALAAEKGHGPWAGTQVQCPSLSLSAPSSEVFKLFVDARGAAATVSELYVSRARAFLDSCD